MLVLTYSILACIHLIAQRAVCGTVPPPRSYQEPPRGPIGSSAAPQGRPKMTPKSSPAIGETQTNEHKTWFESEGGWRGFGFHSPIRALKSIKTLTSTQRAHMCVYIYIYISRIWHAVEPQSLQGFICVMYVFFKHDVYLFLYALYCFHSMFYMISYAFLRLC